MAGMGVSANAGLIYTGVADRIHSHDQHPRHLHRNPGSYSLLHHLPEPLQAGGTGMFALRVVLVAQCLRKLDIACAARRTGRLSYT